MPVRACETCGRTFTQGQGRPARFCPEHRDGGGKYGGEHRKLAAATKDSAWGTPCVRCGRPMLPGQEIHLDHLDGGGPGDYRGWAHAHCNTSAGASKGNRMRGQLNGRAAGLARAAPLAGPDPAPDIRHPPECTCRGTVTYPGPGGFWTSRCW
jgi:hypothetical protein